MDRMSPLDAAFLQAEDEEPGVSLAIASIAVFEGPAPATEEFAEALAGRLPLVPRYRQKAREVPLDVGPPVWVDDPAFDLGTTSVAPHSPPREVTGSWPYSWAGSCPRASTGTAHCGSTGS